MKDAFVPTSRPALGVFAVLSFAGVALAPDALTAGVAATAWYAPIHAWRALAQLRAVETVIV